MDQKELRIEFQRQIATLLDKSYPKAAGLSEDDFLKIVKPLGKRLDGTKLGDIDIVNGKLPFVIVIKSELVANEQAMALVQKSGKEGVTKLDPLSTPDFNTIDTISVPRGNCYLLLDIDRGVEFLNVRPADALVEIQEENRSPLTIDEGISVITYFPEFLMKNNCFSLLASRHARDKRVPAIWINANKNPNLGWCWDGNPHTWLGSASCGSRIGL